MTQTLSARIVGLAILACAFPIAVRADLSENTILQTGSALNLDTGAVVSSGGDILWNGSTIAPQGSATVYNVGNAGATNFNGLPQSYWVTLAPAGRSTPIAANLLVVGDAFVANTSSGKVAKVLVVANSGGAITLQFTTFGASAATGPAVAQILNNSSLTPPGMPNYGIAPSSIFIVQGSGLADPGNPVLQDSSAGLPSTLNGASITVVVGGVTTHPALYYTSPAQLAAVLPAATPIGKGTLTVNYRGTNSAPAPIQVVASAIGINEYNQIPIPLGVLNTNIDLGVATDAVTGSLLSFTNSGTPGEIITLWTTGLGADSADSDTTYTSTPHSVNTPLQIYVGGVLANVLYQGSAGYPGVNQINLTIPTSVTQDCQVPLVAVTGNIISNVVVLPIHQGGGTCVSQLTAGRTITGDQILKDTQDTLKAGGLTVIQTNVTNAKGIRTVTNGVGASFFKDTGLLAGAVGRGDNLSPGSCAVYPIIAGVNTLTLVGLDAGSVTFTGPAGLAITLAPDYGGLKGDYGATLAAGVISAGGTFTFSGSGGADVGPFTSTLTIANPNFNWTNPGAAATIDRTQGLLYTWTGGLPGTYVFLGGVSTGSGVTAGYSCKVAVEAGQFTVPSYILLGLPAGSGGASIQQHDTDSTFSATGLDVAGVSAVIEYSVAGTVK
jgi:uncharacterized protein (TIGR03437 family)